MFTTIMDLPLVRSHSPLVRLPAARITHRVFMWHYRLFGVEMVTEGVENIPLTPSIFAQNSSHKYDPMPFRAAILGLGYHAAGVSKGKNWHDPISRFGCNNLGSLPIVSRGYLLVMDFLAVLKRRPTEDEYRALRSHIDAGTPLPASPPLSTISGTARDILGYPFDPSVLPYREAIEDLYLCYQQEFVRLSKVVLSAGHYIQMFPQGSASRRLSKGKIGLMQLAAALGCPIVPVGINGTAEVYPDPNSMRPRKGRLTIRFGKPFRPDLSDLSPDFEAFAPASERRNRAVLERETQGLMERINTLLDPPYQWAPDRESEGARGTHRFV